MNQIISQTLIDSPSLETILASVKVILLSVADVNHLYPYNLYEPSGCGKAIVSVPFAAKKLNCV